LGINVGIGLAGATLLDFGCVVGEQGNGARIERLAKGLGGEANFGNGDWTREARKVNRGIKGPVDFIVNQKCSLCG
jgi:hypothetical protein